MFYTWSIAEAWDWLIHVPVLGFACLVVLALVVAFFAFAFNLALKQHI